MLFINYFKKFPKHAHTAFFWDLDDFPLPADYDLFSLPRKFRSAVRRYDSRYDVSIYPYGETTRAYGDFKVLRYFPRTEKKADRQTRMLLEMIHLLKCNIVEKVYRKLSFMIISKDFPQVFVPYLEDLKKIHGVEIYIAVPDGCVLEDEPLLNTASLVWEWKTLIAGGFAKMAFPYDPNFTLAEDQERDASASAAIEAVGLISKARLKHKLDSVYTEYSAQYLLDFACPRKKNKKGGRKKKGGKNPKLTVKDCLKFALEKGLPKAEHWPHPHLGYLASWYKPFLVCMDGIELVDCVPVTKLGGGTEFGGIDYRIGRGVAKVETGSGGIVSVYKLQGTLMLQIDGVSLGVILRHLKELRIDGKLAKVATGSGGSVYMCMLPGGKELRIDGDLTMVKWVSYGDLTMVKWVIYDVDLTKLGGGIKFGGVECRLEGPLVKVDTGSGGVVSVYKLRRFIKLQTDADFDKLGIKDYRCNQLQVHEREELRIDGDLVEVETDSGGGVYMCKLPGGKQQLRIEGDLAKVETDSGGGDSVQIETDSGRGVSEYKLV